MATAAQTQVLYIVYFGRSADPSGLDYWSTGDRRSQPLKQTAEGFATTPEFADSVAGLTNGQVIDKYYFNLFGRQREAGETYWLNKVNAGEITLDEAGYWISQGAQGTDKVTLDAKLVAADQWTIAVRANPSANFDYNGALAASLGVDFLAPVLGPLTIPTPLQTQQAVAALPPFGTIGFIEANATSASEGSTVIFSLQTIPSLAGQSLNYEIVGAGGLTAADIVGGQLTGSILVDASGVASLAVTLATDAVVDTGESFTVVIPNAITAPAVTVINTTIPSLTVNPEPTGVIEGDTVTFLIASSAIAAGTVLNYTISGVQSADVVGPLTGSVVVGAGGVVPSVVVQISTDLTIETETLQFSITGGGATGTASVVIQDTSPPAKINVAAQPSSVAEAQTLTYLINTTGIAVGSLLTYQITGITAADVLGGAAVLSGTRTVGSGGFVDSVVIQIAEDLVLAENETATLTITNGAVVGFAAATIVDTTPAPALSVNPQPTGVNEGGSVNFLIASIGIAEGTVLSYTISGVQSSDVVGPLTGSVVVGAGGGVPSVLVQIATDLTIETETLQFSVTGGGATGTASVVIEDTTLPPSITVVAQPTAVNEGGVLTFNIGTQSVAVGSTVNFVITGIQANDVLGGLAALSGTRTVAANGSVAPVQITIATDLLVGEVDTATITVDVVGSLPLLTASASAQVVDTSSNVLNLTVNQDIFVETGVTQDLIFSAPVVPGGALGVGFNTLQNVDSLVGGSGQDQLIGSLTSLAGVVVQPLAIRSIETVSISSLNAANTLSLLSSDSVRTLENFSSSSALTFSNIPGQPVPGGLPTVNINGVFLPGASTTLQFQPVALVGNQTLNINTISSGVNVNGGSGAPLRIITGPGIESAVITDAIQVPDLQVDYDLSQFDIPAISISSPNSVRLSTTGGLLGQNGVNLNTTSINGSGITGVFTVDLSEQPGSVSIQGGGGDDQIKGRQGNSTLVGNAGNDSLTTFGGNDSLNGGTGNDTLAGGGGNNSFEGGDGNDSILADSGNDKANGGAGNDTINLGAGNNVATGGEGFDSILTGAGADTLSGGSEDDTITSGAGNDVVAGDSGDDSISYGAGLDDVSGGTGNDYFVGDLTPNLLAPPLIGPTDTIDGNEGINTLELTAANADIIANSSGTPFVDNIQVLNVSQVVGSNASTNQVNAVRIDSSISTVNLFNGTGATASVFTFNPESSTLNISTQSAIGTLGADATFNVVGTGANDSLTINGPSDINYLNGKNLTFNGFDASTVTINTVNANQVIGTIATTPTVGEDSRFVFQGSGGFTIGNVVATAGDLTLDFTGLTGRVLPFSPPFAIVNGTDVVAGSTVSILGSAGSDTFIGDTAQSNTVVSFGGNDFIVVGSGNDFVAGGEGNDTITPGTGVDTVFGDAGDDRFNVGSNLTLADRFDGGEGVDTIQLTGKLGVDPIPGVIAPFAQGYTASDLAGVSNFEVLELEVNNILASPLLITVQDLYNFTVNGNILETVNLTNVDGEPAPSVLLYNAPSTLSNLGILDSLDEVTLLRRIDTDSDSLTVNLVDGSDLDVLNLYDEEVISLVLSGDTFINTLDADDLRVLNVSGFGSLTIVNPIVDATNLSVLNLSGFSITSIDIDASVSTVDMTVTGPTGDSLIPVVAYQLNLDTGSGNDNIIATGFGVNTINSNAGNDTIQTDGFADSLISGLGNDSVSSGDGNDTVIAGAGNDVVDGGDGNDLLEGDPNNDSTNSPSGNDTLFGGLGDDTLVGGLGADSIDGEEGIDTYEAGFTISTIPPFVSNPVNTGKIVGQLINLSTVTIDANAVPFITNQQVSSLVNDVQPGSTLYLYAIPLLPPLFGSTVSDKLLNVENVVGTNGKDYIIGSGDINTAVADRNTQATQNVLDGGAGDDTYQGGYGQDTFLNFEGSDFILDLGLVESPGIEDIIVGAGAITTAQLGDSWTAGANTVNDGIVNINLEGYNADLSASQGGGLYIVNGTLADELVIGSDNGDFINGDGGNDTLVGRGGTDTINGDAGNDIIFGGDDNDLLDGDEGNDTILGGLGNDEIDGGTEDDSIEGNAGSDEIDGGDGNDVIDGGIEDDLIDGDAGNDSIVGGDGNDVIDGGTEDDTITGDADSDSILGGDGNDVIDGGTEDDTIQGNADDDAILGGDGNDAISGDAGDDTLEGEAGNDTVEGGLGNDLITGQEGDDLLSGNEGADSIFGNESNDTIVGGLGDDSIDGGAASDSIDGGEGEDNILGGAGIDLILGGIGNDTILGESGSDTIDAGAGFDSVIGGQGDDSIIGAGGSDTLFGGLGNDAFTGNDGDDSIVSDEGSDSALGGDGNDTITLGAEADTLFGDAGNDSLLGGDGADVIDGDADDDSIFAGTGDDSVIGGTGNDSIDAGRGDDTVQGGAGTDTIVAQEGNDVVDGGIGNDIIAGGLGDDILFGGDGSDDIVGGDGNDAITGGNDADLLKGEAGNDFIFGNDGADIIAGESGNDSIEGGFGADTIDGGTGDDTIFGWDGADLASLGDGDSVLGGAGFDSIQGNDDGDTIDGGTQDDTITGGSGSDSILGGFGNDIIGGGADDDTVEGNAGSDTISGGVGNDVIDGGIEDDSITGDAGDDEILGGAGNDTIEGNAGSDEIEGGDGNDTIAGGTEDDTIKGNAGSDKIAGGDGNDEIDGGIDDDSIEGNAGSDEIEGGDGNDVIDGGTEDDNIMGSAGNDMIDGGVGNDVIDSGTEDDSVNGGLGDDTIFGQAGNDTIVGGPLIPGFDGDDFIDAGEGNDTVDGGNGGNDTILGGLGDDSLTPGEDSDSVSGGAGNDFISGNFDTLLGADSLFGDEGIDTIQGAFGNDSIDGGIQYDSITGGDGNDSILGGFGNDLIEGNAGSDTIGGGDGSDVIDGGIEDDTITGDDGDDLILGDLGDDNIQGNAGSDTIGGGDGNDVIDGGIEDDTITGDGGDDLILGDFGDDTIEGNAGSDTIGGGDGNDVINGGTEDDILTGGDGIDTFIVDAGIDQITDLGLGGINEIVQVSFGAALNAATLGDNWTATTASFNDGSATINLNGFAANLSQITGTTGWTLQGSLKGDTAIGSIYSDTISGDDSGDNLAGGDGDDIITGGTDVDQLTGGFGSDTFVQSSGDSVAPTSTALGFGFFNPIVITNTFTFADPLDPGVDRVTDFNSLTDQVDFDGSGASNILGQSRINTAVGNWYGIGDFVGNTFILGLAGNDVLLFRNSGTNLTTASNVGTASIVLDGAAANWNPALNVI